MKTIKFFDNHNSKLGCHYFTTIRPDYGGNPPYYCKGEEYGIILRSGPVSFIGKIISIKKFLLADINEYIAYLDYGKSPQQLTNLIKSMYPNKDFTKEKLLFILIENTQF